MTGNVQLERTCECGTRKYVRHDYTSVDATEACTRHLLELIYKWDVLGFFLDRA